MAIPNPFNFQLPTLDEIALATQPPTKKDTVSKAVQDKQQVLSAYRAVNTTKEAIKNGDNNSVYDGDSTGLGANYRMYSGNEGTSFDAYEVGKGKETLKYQRVNLADQMGIPSSQVTDEMIFAKGQEDRHRTVGLMKEGQQYDGPMQDGGNLEDNPTVNYKFGGKGKFGRTLTEVINPVTGKNLAEVLNTRETNAAYNAPFNRARRAKDRSNLAKERELNRDRTGLEVAQDTALGLSKFAVTSGETVAGVVDLGVDAIKSALGYNKGTPTKEELGADGLAGYVARTNMGNFERTRQILNDLQSDPTKRARAKLQASEQEWAEDRKNREAEYTAQGLSDTEKVIVEQSASAKHTLGAYLDNPLTIVDEAVTSAPHMLNAAAVGKFFGKKLFKGMTKRQMKEYVSTDAGKKAISSAAEKGGVTYTALSEGISNGVGVEQDILNTSHKDLASKSEKYNELLKTMSPDEARVKVAREAKYKTTAVAATIGGVTSKVTRAGKFEAEIFNKGIGKTALGKGVKQVVGNTARETLEESAQGAGGQFARNIGKQDADNAVGLSEGTGSGSASGAIIGAASGGGMATASVIPKVTIGTMGEAVGKVSTVNKDKNMSATISDPNLNSKIEEGFDVQTEIVDKFTTGAKETYSHLVQKEGKDLTQEDRLNLAAIAGITKDIHTLNKEETSDLDREKNIYANADASTKRTLENIATHYEMDSPEQVVTQILGLPEQSVSNVSKVGEGLKKVFSKERKTTTDGLVTRKEIQSMPEDKAADILLSPAYNKKLIERNNEAEIKEYKGDLKSVHDKLVAKLQKNVEYNLDNPGNQVNIKPIKDRLAGLRNIASSIQTKQNITKAASDTDAVTSVANTTNDQPATPENEQRVSSSVSTFRGSEDIKRKFNEVLNSEGVSNELKNEINTRIASETALEQSGKSAEEVRGEVLTNIDKNKQGGMSLRSHLDGINTAYHAKNTAKATKLLDGLKSFQASQQEKIDILSNLPSSIKSGDPILRADGKRFAVYKGEQGRNTLLSNIQEDTNIINDQVVIYDEALRGKIPATEQVQEKAVSEPKQEVKTTTPSVSTETAPSADKQAENPTETSVNTDIQKTLTVGNTKADVVFMDSVKEVVQEEQPTVLEEEDFIAIDEVDNLQSEIIPQSPQELLQETYDSVIKNKEEILSLPGLDTRFFNQQVKNLNSYLMKFKDDPEYNPAFNKKGRKAAKYLSGLATADKIYQGEIISSPELSILANIPYDTKQLQDIRNSLVKELNDKDEGTVLKEVNKFYQTYGYPSVNDTLLSENTRIDPQTLKTHTGAKQAIHSVIYSAGQMMSAMKKEATSILGTIPDVFPTAKVSSNAKKALQEDYGLGNKEMSHVTGALQDYVVGFREEFDKLFRNTNLDNTYMDNVSEDPMQLLKDEQGNIPTNVKDAVAIATRTWLATKSSNTKFNEDEVINKILNRNPEDNVSDTERTLLSSAGTLEKLVTQEIGKAVRKQLNISVNKNVEGNFEHRLDASLGMMGLSIASNLGLIEMYSIDNSNIREVVENSTIEEGVTKFIRLKPQLDNQAKQIKNSDGLDTIEPKVQEIIDYSKGIEESINKKLFNISTGFRSPLSEAKTSVPKYMQGTMSELSPAMKENILFAQKTEFAPKENMFKLANLLGTDRLLDINGYNKDNLEETLHYTQIKGVEGKNRGIAKAIAAAFEYMGTREGDYTTPYFQEFDVWKNNRSGLTNSDIDMQKSKYHRHMFGAKNWDAEVDLSNPKHVEQLQLAIGEGLGLKITSTMLNAENFGSKIMDAEGNINDFYAEAVSLLNQDKESYTDSEKDIITEAIKAGGEEMFSADALMNLAAYKKARGSKSTTVSINIGREIDGTTNGVITGVLQLISDPDDKNLLDILRAGGIFFEGDIAETSQEYLEQPGNDDNYKSITKVVNKVIAAVLLNIESDSNTNPKFKFGGEFKKEGLNQNINKIVTMIDKFMGNFIDNDGAVTKDGRNFSKGPLMITAYGAGAKKIKESIGRAALADFYSSVVENKDNQSELDKLANNISNVTGIKFTLDSKDALTDRSLETRLKKVSNRYGQGTIEDRFIAVIGDTYGVAMEQALNDRLGSFTESRTVINNAVNIANKVFLVKYESEFNKLLELNGNIEPTKEQKIELLTRLRDEGILPTVQHATSTGLTDSLQFMETSSEQVPEGRGGIIQQKYKDGAEVQYTDSVKGIGQTKKSSSSNVQTRVPSDNLSVKPFLGLNIAMDGNINGKRFGTADGLNVFDAFLGNLLDTVPGTQDYNKIYHDFNKNYGIAQAVEVTFNRTMDNFNNLSKEEQAKVTESIQAEKGGIKMPSVDGKKADSYASIEQFQIDFNSKIADIKSAHDITMDKITKLDQFSGGDINAVFKPTKKTIPDVSTATDNANTEALDPNSDQRNSSEKEIFSQEFTNTYSDLLTADTTTQIFDDLSAPGISNKHENQQHSERLRSVITELINPVLRAGDSMYLKHIKDSNEDKNIGAIDGDMIYMKSSQAPQNNYVQMSSQEVFTHEMAHNILEAALTNNYMYRKEMQKLLRLAKDARDNNGYKIITYESFMSKDRNGNVIALTDMAAEVAAAKEMYDYVMNSPKGYLHEFAVFGLTNENFINDLNKITVQEKSIDKSLPLYEQLLELIGNMFNWVTGTVYGTNGKRLNQALLQMGRNARNINLKAKGEVFSFSSGVRKINSVTIDIASKAIVKPYMSYLHKVHQNPSTNVISNAYKFGVGIPFMVFDVNFGKAVEEFLDFMGISSSSTISLLLQEIKGKKGRQKVWDRMLRNSKHLHEGSRERITEGITKQLRDSFDNGKQLTDATWRGLNNSILKTDLSSVAHLYTPDTLAKILHSETRNNREIHKIENALEDYGDNHDHYIKQAHSLGHYMARGKAGLKHQMLNSHNIANLITKQTKNIKGDLVKAEQLIDTLATLYAIKYTAPQSNKIAADMITSEFKRNVPVNGIQRMIDQHNQFKAISLKRNFDSNKILMVKGYTKEQYNAKYSMKVGTLADETKYADEGYKRTARPITKDSLDAMGSAELYIYTSDHGLLGRFMSGISSLTNMTNKGTLLSETYMQGHMDKPGRTANQMMKEMHTVNSKSQKSLTLDFQDNHLIPVLNDNGHIADYRYVMSEQNKIELMGKDDKAPVVLASMVAGIEDKINTVTINEAVVKQAKEEFNKYGLARKNKFVELGPDSTGELGEYYKLMPDAMKQNIKDIWGQDSMMIEESMLGTIIGFRKASVLNTKFGKMLPRVLRHNMRLASNLWAATVKLAKHKIVILTPGVLIGNVTSNSVILMYYGISPNKMIADQTIALAALSEYLTKLNKKDGLQREIENSSNAFSNAKIKNLKRQVEIYDQDLKANPVATLIDEGLYSTIVEDINLNTDLQNDAKIVDTIPTSWGGDYIRDALDNDIKEGSIIKRNAYWGYKQATLSPDTKVGSLLLKATQKSDFVARYTLYNHLTKVESKTHASAIEEVLEVFIDYNVNTSPNIQWMNDMGFLMFTKFLLRIQRVIMKMVKEKPGSLLATEVTQRALGTDIADITDSNIISSIGIDRFTTPSEIIDQATGISAFNYLDLVGL